MASSEPPQVYRLIYVSTAVGVLPAHELDRILLRARVSNSASGVTGFLLFHEGSFLHVLEGPEAAITSLLESIRRDRRHANLQVLEAGSVSGRIFPGQPMGYLAPRNLSADHRSGLSRLQGLARQSPAPQRAGSALGDALWSVLSGFSPLRAA